MDEKKRRVLPLGGRNLRGLGLCLGLFLLWICLLLPLGRDILDRNRQNGAMRNRIRQLAVFAGQWDPEKSGEEKRRLDRYARENRQQSPEAWAGYLETEAARSGLQVLRLAPLNPEGKALPSGLEADLEGSFPQLFTFFRQWETRYPGVYTRDGRLETRERGKKVLFHGKFITGPVKSSKSREIPSSY
ncbi:MAG: hypothetical protein HUJ81_05270 [Acidaminococcus fermentans]|uniref:Uncharacterized protein n=1 Tax=Acidaminococcus fermentans TaxID=905 RepID=A0A1H2XQJ0_ACIFE|nr:hypothetical protein [Acidaminococcus fermentans]MCF0139495.1 hypothetical protein [Acidaminococcus fermentans]SDW95036.1 hypothetical protein SAMN05216495_10964 [Acidaminococcus fermentans]